MVDIILDGLKKEFDKCTCMDEINKLYRQARIWVRITYIIGGVGTKEDAHDVNRRIKNIRWTRMKELGYPTPDKFVG